MSPLRPIVRRQQGLLRNIRRNYATPATPSASAKEASTKGAEAVNKSKEAGSAAGQATVAKANDILQKSMEKVGPMASKIGQTTANVMSKIPGGGEKVVGGVQCTIIFNSIKTYSEQPLANAILLKYSDDPTSHVLQ